MLFPDPKAPNPQNPDRVIFKAQNIAELNRWFPDEFGISRELAASGTIPTSVIESAAATMAGEPVKVEPVLAGVR